MTKKFTVKYDSNNSGGDWWLTDEDWKNLEEAGWTVNWKERRWLDALATSASKEFEAESEDDAITAAEFNFTGITGQSTYEQGCDCCGPPHNFYGSLVE